MKKALCLMLALFSFVVMPAAYAADSGDTFIDKASDWFATVGKSPEDRDMILAQRRSERAAKRLSKAMNDGVKKAGNKIEAFGKSLGGN